MSHHETDNIEQNTSEIEQTPSETDDGLSDDSIFNFTSWCTDLTFKDLLKIFGKGELLRKETLVRPEEQRQYVWDKITASRFIESILIGLPLPSIYLANNGSQKVIVDGFQRIMTVHDYVAGTFSKDGSIFKLSNTAQINARWRDKAFEELSINEQNKIKGTLVRTIIFEPKHPTRHNACLYQIFERLNTVIGNNRYCAT